MTLLFAVVVSVVGLFSGIVIRWVAGLAAVLALVLVLLSATTPDTGLVNFVIEQYYQGNELLFLAGLLFGLDAEHTRDAVKG